MTADYPIKFPRKLIEVALPLDAIDAAYAVIRELLKDEPFREG